MGSPYEKYEARKLRRYFSCKRVSRAAYIVVKKRFGISGVSYSSIIPIIRTGTGVLRNGEMINEKILISFVPYNCGSYLPAATVLVGLWPKGRQIEKADIGRDQIRQIDGRFQRWRLHVKIGERTNSTSKPQPSSSTKTGAKGAAMCGVFFDNYRSYIKVYVDGDSESVVGGWRQDSYPCGPT